MEEIIVRDKYNNVVAVFSSEQGNTDEARKNTLQSPNVSLTENGESVFTFSMLTYAEKWKQINNSENTYEVDGKIFIARGENAFRTAGKKVTVTAVELWYELRDKFTQAYNVSIGSNSKEVVDEQTILLLPKSTAPLIVDGETITNPYPRGSFGYNAYAVLYNSGWKLGVCDVIVDGFNAQEDYGCFNIETDMKDILSNLEYMRSLYGGVFVWDSKNKILNIRDETKANSDFNKWKGFEIREGKNIVRIETVQNNHVITRLFPFGEGKLNIKAVNNGKTYLDNFQYSQSVIKANIDNPNIYDQNQLKFWGQRKLEEISKPREIIEVDFVDLRNVKGHETDLFNFLDVVSVVYIDKSTNKEVTKDKRLISVSYNPLKRGNVSAKVGDKILNQQEILKQALLTTDKNAKEQFSSHDIYDKEYGKLNDFLEENDNFTAELRHDVNSNHASIELNTEYINKNTTALANFKVEVTQTYATITSLAQFKTETSNALTSINQKADRNSAEISANARYIDNVNDYAASIELKADRNGSRISIQANEIDILSDNFSVIDGNLSALSGRFDYLSASAITANNLYSSIADLDYISTKGLFIHGAFSLNGRDVDYGGLNVVTDVSISGNPDEGFYADVDTTHINYLRWER